MNYNPELQSGIQSGITIRNYNPEYYNPELQSGITIRNITTRNYNPEIIFK